MRSIVFTLAMLAAPAAGQGITLAEGDPQALTVRVLQENNLSAAGTVLLQNVEFVDIEITGRLAGQELDASRSRRVEANGLWRVEVPGGGRLLRYQRDGGQHHGFLWIPPDGIATVVLERPGTGVSGLESPFADRIGIAPRGGHAAVPVVGGGLELMRLRGPARVPNVSFAASGAAANEAVVLQGNPQPEVGGTHRFVPTSATVFPTSVMVGSHVFFVTADERIWRLSLEDGSQPEDVSPPPVPGGEFKDQLALSGDGKTVVFLYGPDRQQNMWVLGGIGPASMLPTPTTKYEEPGYLPEDTGHARMLLNEDGTRLLYTDNTDRDEIFLLDLSVTTPNHLTGDDTFEPYIGVGILPFFSAGTLLMAIGDEQRMDWFIADSEPGSIENLTLTGPSTKPYAEGLLAPQNGVLTPASLLVTETTAAGGLQLRCMTPQIPQGEIVYDDLLGDLVPGNQFSGRSDLLVKTSSGDRLLDGDTGDQLLALPAGISLSAPARSPRGGLSVFRATVPGGLGAAVFRLQDGTLLVPPPVSDLKQAVFTAQGGVLINADALSYLRRQGITVIPTNGETLVLSGAGS